MSGVCRLCGTPLPDSASRCPSCGLHQDTELSRATRWRLGAGLLGVYVAAAVLVALLR